VVEVTGGRLEGGAYVALPNSPVRVSFRWGDERWSVSKNLVFLAEGYQLEASVSTAPAGVPAMLMLGPGANPVSNDSRNVFLGESAPIFGPEGLERWAADDLETPQNISGPVRWVGIESHYFLKAFLLDGEGSSVRLSSVALDTPPSLTEEGETQEPLALVEVAVEMSSAAPVAVFMGPKKYDLLATQGSDLQQVVDFGWFGVIARPLLALLLWIQSFVGNYGIAIILLTVLLRLVFLPLNHKAMVSMRRTQQLQPQMASIRAKYKGVSDLEKRQKMNEEVMELYRREGVSPFGGCLPMLAQLPILFAFYRLLSVAVELRGAPFALWIQDLSKYDPYLVLPLLMGASMLVQQRMTPTAGVNPAQARMMRLMPVMFTVLFLYVPSGLVLYWLVNNVLGIAQQVYVNKRIMGAPAAKSAPKKGKKSQRGKR
jgi:YidC/Oxa1 family membrane protein insertase